MPQVNYSGVKFSYGGVICVKMDSEEDALLVGTAVKDDEIIDDQISEQDLKSDNLSNGNCKIITSTVSSRRSDEPTELSFEKSRFCLVVYINL